MAMNKILFRKVASVAFTAMAVAPTYAKAAAPAAPAADQRTSEIVVTAQFRSQKLQDTPIAITAVNAAMLEARGQTDIAQVAAQAPNVVLRPQ
jgi:iron complex outermembrane receptor protein